MEYIVAKLEEDNEFELFVAEDVKTLDEKVITAKKSIGRFNVKRLSAEKTMLLDQIKELQERVDTIDEKIKAIESFK